MRFPEDTKVYQYSMLVGKKFPCHKCETSYVLQIEVPTEKGKKSRSWTVAVLTWGLGESILLQECLMVKCPKYSTAAVVLPIGEPELSRKSEEREAARQGATRGK